MRVHPMLEDARRLASSYRVMKSERGYHVWRFFPWSSPIGGWRIIVPDCRCGIDAWLHVLNDMRLLSEAPPPPLPPPAKVTWHDAEWF